MKIIDNRAVLLRTRTPEKFSIIPKHKKRSVPGGAEVLVNWGLHETKLMRNMGYDIPSPITGRYSWPGRYKPMAHQIETAAFSTLNRRMFIFDEAGCVDSETEYLSPTGWQRIADYQAGQVAQYHPESGATDFVTPEAFVKKPCSEMIRVKTHYGVDQLLSPEHRMVIRDNAAVKGKWCVMSAAEVKEAHDIHHAGVRLPKNYKQVGFTHMSIPATFSTSGGTGIALTDAQLRVQVAVIADAYIPNKTNTCIVRLKRERKVLRMRSLLTAAGITFKERQQNTPTAKGYTIYTFAAPLHTKEFGTQFWNCSTAQLAVIAEEVAHWDGTLRGGNKGSSFSTTSKASADFIQYVWCSQGSITRITEDTRKEKYKGGACYTVQRRGERSKGLLCLKNRKDATVTAAPSTDGFKYCFTVPSTFLLFRRNGCIFGSGNTGKTLSTLWAADYLMEKKLVRRCLIICPMSIMQSAWMGDLNKSILHRSAIVAHHAQASRRIEMIQSDYEFVIINYDGLPLVAEEIKKDGRFDLIIADECSAYSVATTRRWKALHKILTPDTMLWMMTGTPAAQSPLQAYGLAKLVNPNAVPNYFTAWRDKVMYKLTMFKWVPKTGAKDEVFRVLQPAIRHLKSECLDLPPVMTLVREVPMTPQQNKYYKLIKEQMLAQAAGETISAVNKAAVVSKLLQISAAAALTDTKEVIEFDATPRLNVLLEILEETERKVIIFAMFRASIEVIQNFLVSKGVPSEVIHGGVTATHRGDIINRFQNTPEPRVLVMQPQATAHGITLTAADTVVFFGPLMSVEQYIQGIARADRKGQNAAKVTVFQIQSSPIEKKMFDAMNLKVDDHAVLTRMFDEEMGDKL